MTVSRIFAVLVLASVAGCGLQEYQKRMDMQLKRMKLFDDEDRSLERPIDQPLLRTKDKKEVPAWPGIDVYLRPPKGFDYQDKDFTTAGTVNLFRFPGPKGLNLFVAASKVGEPKQDGTFMEGELSVDEFRSKTLQALREFYRKEYKQFGADLRIPTDPPKKIEKQPEAVPIDPPLIKYEEIVIPDTRKIRDKDKEKDKDNTHFLAYFTRNGIRQVGIIYQLPKKDDTNPELAFQRDLSLKSLELSDNANKRSQYLTERRNTPAPAKKSDAK